MTPLVTRADAVLAVASAPTRRSALARLCDGDGTQDLTIVLQGLPTSLEPKTEHRIAAFGRGGDVGESPLMVDSPAVDRVHHVDADPSDLCAARRPIAVDTWRGGRVHDNGYHAHVLFRPVTTTVSSSAAPTTTEMAGGALSKRSVQPETQPIGRRPVRVVPSSRPAGQPAWSPHGSTLDCMLTTRRTHVRSQGLTRPSPGNHSFRGWEPIAGLVQTIAHSKSPEWLTRDRGDVHLAWLQLLEEDRLRVAMLAILAMLTIIVLPSPPTCSERLQR